MSVRLLTGKTVLGVDGDVVVLSANDLIIKMEDMPGFLTAKTNNILISLNTDQPHFLDV